jgi:hypothetical protein
LKPIVDTTQYRDAIKKAFASASKADRTPKFSEGEGVEEVPADDQELMGEGVAKPLAVRHWAGWVYQKREDGAWDKLCPSPESEPEKPKRKIQKKSKE